MAQHVMTLKELAEVTGIHRQTIARRLALVQPLPGSSSKRKIYDLKIALANIYGSGRRRHGLTK